MEGMKTLRPLLALLAALVLAAVPATAHATDSHAPHGARGDWLPADEWVMSQWLPYDEATLDHLLRTDRDELASWLDDHRTLGALARKRGFRPPATPATPLPRRRGSPPRRPPARRPAAARGAHMSPGLRRTLERRALDPLTQAPLARH